MKFLAKRLIHGVFLLVGVSLFSFALLELAPGDFFEEMRLNPQISAGTIAGLRKQYGLGRPLPVRYVRWVQSVAKGELGFSFSYNSPVGPLLGVRARNTLLLTVTATAMAWLLAIPLGVWAASKPRGWLDHLMNGSTSVLLAVPEILLALGLLLLAVRTGLLPAGGMVSPGFAEFGLWQKAQDLARHLLLPVLVLVLGMLPTLVRHVRAAMNEVLDSPFIRALRAYGISPQRLLFRHALRAAANPLVSLFGLSVASLLSGSLLVEVILSWPGIGPIFLEAILARDLHLVIGAIMISTLFLLAGNFLADALLVVLDPRIRVEHQ
jgi:peptide/nickel transport system permease protein